MARRGHRKSGRRRASGTHSTFVGLAILLIAGFGVWLGAEWSDGGGIDFFRTLGSESAAERIDGPSVPEGTRVRVEILNAGGVRGMAAAARDELRDLGYDVVYFGNATTFDQLDSEVVHRGGDAELARAAAEALDIQHFESVPDTTRLVEVTVRLGSNWRPREERAPATPDTDG